MRPRDAWDATVALVATVPKGWRTSTYLGGVFSVKGLPATISVHVCVDRRGMNLRVALHPGVGAKRIEVLSARRKALHARLVRGRYRFRVIEPCEANRDHGDWRFSTTSVVEMAEACAHVQQVLEKVLGEGVLRSWRAPRGLRL